MMKLRWSYVALAAAGVLAAACGDSTSPSSDDLSDSSMEADLAASAGADLANTISLMVASEQSSGSALNRLNDDAGMAPRVQRTYTCYDGHGAVVECGTGLTASALITLDVNGAFTGPNLTFRIHRQARDSISGLESGSETRTHNGFAAEQDTVTFAHPDSGRSAGIAAADSAVDLVFNLPHSSNPWPVSGQFIRNVDATFNVTRGGTQTRHIARRIVVSFPADAQGNVSIEVGTLTCNLNLVTGLVTECTGG